MHSTPAYNDQDVSEATGWLLADGERGRRSMGIYAFDSDLNIYTEILYSYSFITKSVKKFGTIYCSFTT